MNVYVVLELDWIDHVKVRLYHGVFATEAQAQFYIDAHPSLDLYIEEEVLEP